MLNKDGFLLSIYCMTFNQSAYITDAFNGFVMQKTSFPFVVVVVDDASTDGEREVIGTYVDKHFDCTVESGFRKWETEDADWVFARHKENKNCHFVTVFLKSNLFGNPKKSELIKEWFGTKYFTICEGDDYWTDPLKLQKQVDFMEGNPDFSICYHEVKILLQEKGTLIADNLREVPYVSDIFELAKGNYIHTLSAVFRHDTKVYDEIQRASANLVVCDYVYHMMYARQGKIKKLPDCMGVYRLNEGSVWGMKDEMERLPLWNEMLIRMMPFFDEKVQQILHEQYIQNCKDMFSLGEHKVRLSRAYRLGTFLLNPLKVFKSK